MRKQVMVTGAGGFIGGHLVKRLVDDGHHVWCVDTKPLDQWHQVHQGTDILSRVDLKELGARRLSHVMHGMEEVYALAADMGGMGFIESHKLDCMLSVNISTNTMWAAQRAGVERLFYASSACVYPGYRQDVYEAVSLAEDDAYPADAEDGYGWEKLFSERMGRHFDEETDLIVRVGRYHNVYGPKGTYWGGREKAPAAICRKVAIASITGNGSVDVWGNGKQVRSYMYIDDCVEGTLRVMRNPFGSPDPLNIGSSEAVSVDQLIDAVELVAGVKVMRMYDMSQPQGVRGRSSDNTKILEELGWEPSTSLLEGIEKTYAWVYDQVKADMKEVVA